MKNLFFLIILILGVKNLEAQKVSVLKGTGVTNFKFKGIEFENFRSFNDDEDMINFINSKFGKPENLEIIILGDNYKYEYDFTYKNFELKYYKKYGNPELFEMTMSNGAPTLLIENVPINVGVTYAKQLNKVKKENLIELVETDESGPNALFQTEDAPYYFEFLNSEDKVNIMQIKLYLMHD